MGKRISQNTQLTAAQLATTDILPIVDVSAGQTKYITVKDLTGAPDFSWQATGESWAYSSYSSTTRIGVVTVPSDATTKYTLGMRIRVSQTTGGTKYAIIHGITSTTLSLFMQSGSALTNETITSPVYSSLDTPLGFPKSEDNWKLRVIDSVTRQSNTPTASTWYVPSGSTLNQLVGIGKYVASYSAIARTVGSSSAWCTQQTTLSTTTNSETNTDLYANSGIDSPSSGSIVCSTTHVSRAVISVASSATYTLLHWVSVQGTVGATCGFYQKSWIEFTSAYL